MRCKHDDCTRQAYTFGWCSTHYRRLRSGQPMDAPIRRYVRIQETVGSTNKPADGKPVRRKRRRPSRRVYDMSRTLVSVRFCTGSFFKKIAVAALASVSLLPAPVAGADSDSEYLEQLGWIGITPATTGRPPVALLGIGRATCGDLAQGADPNLLAAQLQGVVRLAQSQSRYTMGQLWVTTAVTTLCPTVLPHPLPWAPQHP